MGNMFSFNISKLQLQFLYLSLDIEYVLISSNLHLPFKIINGINGIKNSLGLYKVLTSKLMKMHYSQYDNPEEENF